MLIPWASDAPLYHRPIGTIVLIALSVALFVLFPARDYESWTLVLGGDIHPLQWLTNLFMHAGWGHLIGNMIFLWTFGIIVEGKLGWWAFTLVYLGLGAIESAGMQLLVHSEEPIFMVGASAIILGLLAMCLVWAPRNDVLCIAWFRFAPAVFELSILWFVGFYIIWDIVTASLKGIVMANLLDHSSGAIVALALDHSSGAILGFVLAIVLLKLDLVDCEDWDLFAVLQGRQGKSRRNARKTRLAAHRVSIEYDRPPPRKRKRSATSAGPRVKSIEDPRAAALRRMRLHLEHGETEAAVAIFKSSSRKMAGWNPEEADWLDLIQAILDQNAWGEAASVMLDYLRRSSRQSPRVRLKLAQVLIQKLARPLQALKLMEQIPDGTLPQRLELERRRLVQQAEHMRDQGELELEDEMW
jgi:membrane associated rhomboid family serine protease